MNRIASSTLTTQNISAPLLVYTYTADADRELIVQVSASGLAGNGNYLVALTRQISGTGTAYQSPSAAVPLASGATTLTVLTTSLAVESGDVVKVYLQGLTADTSVGVVTEVFDVQAALSVVSVANPVTLTSDYNAAKTAVSRQDAWRASGVPNRIVAPGVFKTLFETNSGASAGTDFGVYASCELPDGTLLVALGNPPASVPGAIIARMVDNAPVFEFALDEEGVAIMDVHAGKVYVVGADATEDPSFGNVYIRDTAGVWTKLRTVPNAIHILGQTWDDEDIWYISGSRDAGGGNYEGRVWKSIDDGQTWTLLNPVLCDYRAFGITYWGGIMYIAAQTQAQYGTGVSTLYQSYDMGFSWSSMNLTVHPRPRWIVWNSVLLGVTGDKLSLISFDWDMPTVTYTLPFTLGANNYQYNLMTIVGGTLYVLGYDGIYITTDLVHWARLTKTDFVPRTLGRWTQRQSLLVGNCGGTNSGLYEVPLTNGDVLAYSRVASATALATYAGPTKAELDAALAGLNDPSVVEIVNAILTASLSSGGAWIPNERTVRAALAFIRNRWKIEDGVLTVYQDDDTTVAWTAPVTGTTGANPVTGIDPT